MVGTQVAIIGAGPAGLMLSHLLQRAGIDSVVLENRSREYVERRIRAGVLEHGAAQLLRDNGVGDRMDREGLLHRGIYVQFEGERHHIDFVELTGRGISVYGQQEIVKDLIQARLAAGGKLLFEAEATHIGDFGQDDRARVRHPAPDAGRVVSGARRSLEPGPAHRRLGALTHRGATGALE